MKLSVLVSVLLFSVAAQAKDPVTAYVDFQRISDESVLGKQIKEDAVMVRSGWERRLSEATQAASRAKGAKDEAAKTQAATDTMNEGNKQIKNHSDEQAAALLTEVRKVVAKIAQEKHYDQVDQSSHLYTRNDITDLVISRLDAQTNGAAERLRAENEALKKKLQEKDSAPPAKKK